MKKLLLLLLFPLPLFGQAVSTRNFDTNYFQIQTNVSPYDITINTNAGSAASSWVTNLSGGGTPDLWTNDTVFGLKTTRPVNQTRSVSLVQVSTNYQGLFVEHNDTNTADIFTLGGYFLEVSTNAGVDAMDYLTGSFGSVGESAPGFDIGTGSFLSIPLLPIDSPGVFGVSDGLAGYQIGVGGLAFARLNGQTNVGASFRASSNGKTSTKNIALLLENSSTASQNTPIAHSAPIGSTLLHMDTRDSGDWFMRFSTNNGASGQLLGVNPTSDLVIPQNDGIGKVLMDSDGAGTARWRALGYQTNAITTNTPAGMTNVIQGLITNSINQNARIGPGTLNQIAKFVNPTNVGDSILSEISQQFVDLKAGSATPDGSQDALLRIFDNYTNATGYKDLRLGWKVGNGEFEIATEQGSGVATSVPILTFGSGGVQWGIAATTDHTFYPLGDDTTSMGGVSGRIHAFYLGTLGIQATTGSKVFSYGNAGGMSGSASILSVNDSSAVEQFRFDSTSGPRLDLGPNKLVFGPSINAPDVFLFRLSSGILSISTNNTGSGSGQLAGIQGGDGSGTDKAAGSVTINGGAPTGSGRAGDVLITTSTNGATGSSPRGFQSRIFVSAHEAALTESSATLVANITVPSKAYLGITVTATTHADDGTDFQSVHEIFSVAAVSKSGTVTTSISASSPMATVQSSGTLTTTWTAVANGNSVDLKCNAVSSLTQTTLSTKWIIDINSDGPAVVTAQ